MELSAELSVESLGELERRLSELADGIQGSATDGALELAMRAAEVARASCPTDTGSLASSIHVEPTDAGADVVASAPYAAFVEFGTGIGTPSDSPLDARAMDESGYEVNASGRGEEGWVYPSDDGGFLLTHGQGGKGFMAAGAEAARADAREVVLSHVRGEAL
ncbi:HK97 gp10 family phage protein [Olsenella uli]|uniref:HK97 gp10 family phage protein n=1 Tax=Olsenella uli TaxID=133926 RepID=UPI0024204C43|nr:HK97 gp10 family phage protein [Olsenella uli]